MSELLPITFVSILLAFLSHKSSDYDPVTLTYKKKEKTFYIVLVICMALFVGLRTDYNDTHTYKLIYEATPISDSLEKIFKGIDWKLGSNPGFELTNRILRYFGASTQTFLMFYAAITVWIHLWFFKKYSRNFAFSVFLYITLGGYAFALAAIKQCLATAFCLVATDRYIQKKYASFVFWVLLGALFHPYALLYLVVPLMHFKPWGGKSIIVLATAVLAGFALQPMLGTIIDITSAMGENYTIESFSGDGINVFRLTVVAVPSIIAFLAKAHIKKEENHTEDLMINLTMLNAEIMFIGLFGTANYFGRLANYFQPFQALSIPWLISFFEKNTRKNITIIAILCYSAFFVYSMMYTGSFDNAFNRISIIDYFRSLLN